MKFEELKFEDKARIIIIILGLLLMLIITQISSGQENPIQDFSSLFNTASDTDALTEPIIYKKFHILIFHNDNGFRFEAHRILKINGQNIRSDKAIKYFSQGFQQYYWDITDNHVGINDYFLLAGNTYRGWVQNSRATHGQMLPWMNFKKGQIVYVSYEYEREWAWAQHWNTKKGAENAAKLFISYVSK